LETGSDDSFHNDPDDQFIEGMERLSPTHFKIVLGS
jgi:hypothetical protein